MHGKQLIESGKFCILAGEGINTGSYFIAVAYSPQLLLNPLNVLPVSLFYQLSSFA